MNKSESLSFLDKCLAELESPSDAERKRMREVYDKVNKEYEMEEFKMGIFFAINRLYLRDGKCMRAGQFISNLIQEFTNDTGTDIFYATNEELKDWLEEKLSKKVD